MGNQSLSANRTSTWTVVDYKDLECLLMCKHVKRPHVKQYNLDIYGIIPF